MKSAKNKKYTIYMALSNMSAKLIGLSNSFVRLSFYFAFAPPFRTKSMFEKFDLLWAEAASLDK